MNKKLLITIVTSLFTISSFSQIEMGKIEKAVDVESKEKFPLYVPTENFINHSDYYKVKITKILESGSGKNPFEEKECDENEYYKRYNGLKIYFPSYSVDYKKDYITFFRKTDKMEILDWTQTGNKYFTIISIVPQLKNSDFFNDAISNFGKNLDGRMLFELKDNSNNEIIYAASSSYEPGFILVPYFEKKKELINGKTFTAVSDFDAIRNPVSKTNYILNIDKGTQWKGELTLIRKKDIKIDESNNVNDEETLLTVILSNEKDKAIFDLEGSRWHFENVLLTKNDFEKLKNENTNKEKSEESVFIKKYGENFGKLVYQKKLTIGMSKDMCSDILGITLNRKNHKNASGEIEVWEYTGIYKLYFKNGKLSEIVKY